MSRKEHEGKPNELHMALGRLKRFSWLPASEIAAMVREALDAWGEDNILPGSIARVLAFPAIGSASAGCRDR